MSLKKRERWSAPVQKPALLNNYSQNHLVPTQNKSMNHISFIQKRQGLSFIRDRYPSLLATKTFLVMKLIFIFCLAFCMQVSANGSAQKITLFAQNATLERVLKDIEKQSGYSFWCKTNLISKSAKITVSIKNSSLEDALNKVLQNQPFDYSIVEETVVLHLKTETKTVSPMMKIQELIKGQVIGADGKPLIGVTVIVKATKMGTTTDVDGNFSVNATDTDILVFSYVGFEMKEVPVGTQSNISVTLSESNTTLGEVVVTAFGMAKEKKALGYSVTQIGGESFTESRTANLGNALSGKIAGVNVSAPATGAGGSSRVVIRGGSSLTGSNQPLYVVNGVPIETANMGSPGMWGGNDAGDGMSSINPDDIESISVLKGSSASALYGYRGSNGVILITTKSGKARKGVGISLNSNTTFDRAIDRLDYQHVYGVGVDGRRANTTREALEMGVNAWGARYDGASSILFDGSMAPYSYTGEGLNDFYRTAVTTNNSVALSGGNEATTFRFSLSDLNNQDIMPNAGFKRRVANVNVNSKLKKFTFALTAQYSKQEGKNRPRLSDSPGNANYSVMTMPGNIPFSLMRGTTGKLGALADGSEMRYTTRNSLQNMYWSAYQFSRKDVTDRIMGNFSLKYDITSWLYVQARLGTDYQNRIDDLVEPYGTLNRLRGSYNQQKRTIREDNADLFIGFNKTFKDISIDGLFGANRMRKYYQSLAGGGENLVVPYFHSITNVAAPAVTHDLQEQGVNSVFGSANIGYKNFLFLSLTGRRDQFSTLAPESSVLFYPSASLSFVVSDVLKMPSAITMTKVRASWAQVGGGAPNPYALNLTYGLFGAGHNGANLGQINNMSIPSATLKPYVSTETEIGADFRFLKNRLGVDLAYYDRKTSNDILATGISSTAGYSSTTINIGELRNRGVELLLTGTPIERNGFDWEVSFNFARNMSKVMSLGLNASGEPITSINLEQSRVQREMIRHVVGQPAGMITGYKQQEINGQKVYDADGYPVATTGFENIAQGRHPISAGLSNNFGYKGFKLGFLIDARFGGHVMSGTNYIAYTSGYHQETVAAREAGSLVVSGVTRTGEANTWTIPADPTNAANYRVDNYYLRYAQITENVVYDASFIKLREFSFGYALPSKILQKTPFEGASLSLVARNLALLWSKTPNIDPESGYSSGGSTQGLEFFAMPVSRSIGFNLSVSF